MSSMFYFPNRSWKSHHWNAQCSQHNTSYFRNCKSASQILGLKISLEGTLSFPLTAQTCSTTKNVTRAAATLKLTWIQVQASILLRTATPVKLLGEGVVGCLRLLPNNPNPGDLVYRGYVTSFINSTHGWLPHLILHTHWSNALNGMLIIFFLSMYTSHF